MPDYLTEILDACGDDAGALADYIPELASADPDRLAVCLSTIDATLRLVDSCTGRSHTCSVTVADGVADLRSAPRSPAVLAEYDAATGAARSAEQAPAVDAETVRTPARTVPGVAAVRVHGEASPAGPFPQLYRTRAALRRGCAGG